MRYGLALMIFCVALQLSAQQNAIDSLKQLGRDSLVSIARKKINDPGINYPLFDRTTVKCDGKNLYVEFEYAIRFVPKTGTHYYSISINLINGSISRYPLNNKHVEYDMSKVKFFVPDPQSKKALNFVFNAINKSTEIGHFDTETGNVEARKMGDEEILTIYDKGSYYYIEMNSPSTLSHYKIDKSSGKIYEASHKHYAQSQDENYEMIK